jgi:hypothetical protein
LNNGCCCWTSSSPDECRWTATASGKVRLSSNVSSFFIKLIFLSELVDEFFNQANTQERQPTSRRSSLLSNRRHPSRVSTSTTTTTTSSSSRRRSAALLPLPPEEDEPGSDSGYQTQALVGPTGVAGPATESVTSAPDGFRRDRMTPYGHKQHSDLLRLLIGTEYSLRTLKEANATLLSQHHRRTPSIANPDSPSATSSAHGHQPRERRHSVAESTGSRISTFAILHPPPPGSRGLGTRPALGRGLSIISERERLRPSRVRISSERRGARDRRPLWVVTSDGTGDGENACRYGIIIFMCV